MELRRSSQSKRRKPIECGFLEAKRRKSFKEERVVTMSNTAESSRKRRTEK